MKAVVNGEGGVAVVDVDEPEGPGARLEIRSSSICGTDLSGYLGKMPFFSYPRIPGHELGVEVVAVGPDVANKITINYQHAPRQTPLTDVNGSTVPATMGINGVFTYYHASWGALSLLTMSGNFWNMMP